MDLLNRFAAWISTWNTDLIICGVTVAGSILCSLGVAGWTYCKAKRLKFYETFFAEKVKAYSEFIDAVSNEIQGDDPNGIKKVVAAQMKAKLYCSGKAFQKVEEVKHAFMCMENPDDPMDLISFGAVYDDAVMVFREDMHNCRKFVFE